MNLVVTPLYQGYLLDDIKAELSLEDWNRFKAWFRDQTGAINGKGRLIVYKHDWDRFVVELVKDP